MTAVVSIANLLRRYWAVALIVAAIGYGVRSGLLAAEDYLPVLRRAWAGLAARVGPSGFVTGCQPSGDKPAPSFTGTAPVIAASGTHAGTLYADEPPFCAGAMLMAAAEMSRLTVTEPTSIGTTAGSRISAG